ncbi:hypothetical protein AAWM_07249 [Aspergillus awamori]|uniref:CCHC-type domain-containing protein n=1 Tax=Aspergillus awamori TaxID=105351 RepID=A0A401KYP1_ASPAW|nr:hypothetical protein AAWM_07249 [Aspergillus awamori]
MGNHMNWRYRAVTVDSKNMDRIRIARRDEAEHQLVKKVAEAKIGAGARVLRDELNPIKADSVKKTAVLDEKDDIRVGAAAAFSEENETTVAKISWLSRKESTKAYGSMVVYLTKGTDARRLLAEGFFHAGGESGVTSAFEHRPRPTQCYNCQEIRHKAFQCKNTQKCAKCAKEGHHHSICNEMVLKNSERSGNSYARTASEENPRLTRDNPNDASQMDEDGPFPMEGRQMGNSKHDFGNEGRGSGASADRIPGSDSGGHQLPERLIFMASSTQGNYKLWGGDDVSLERQGEADPTIGFMNEFALSSLLKLVVDYASNVGWHAFKDKAVGPINRIQRVGAQAIVGTFLTVATSVSEAEAYIATVQSRFWKRALKMWTDIHTLPETHPLRRNTALIKKFRRYDSSPLHQVADALKNIEVETLGTINPFTLAPWEERLQVNIGESSESQTETGGSMQIAVSSSARNEMLKAFSVTLGVRSEQNPYSGELAAMAHALKTLPVLKLYRITLLTSNKAAALTLENSRQQAGQEHLSLIYKVIRKLRRNGNKVTIRWAPTSENNKLLGLAKVQARAATREDAMPPTQHPRMKSTTLNIARSQQGTSKRLPEKVGKHVKRVDAALPSKHTRQLYDRLSWKEARVLAQLWKGHGTIKRVSLPDPNLLRRNNVPVHKQERL